MRLWMVINYFIKIVLQMKQVCFFAAVVGKGAGRLFNIKMEFFLFESDQQEELYTRDQKG